MNNEPVAWMIKTLDGRSLMLYGEEQPPKFKEDVQYIPLYTHPVKELTDDEIAELSDKILCYQIYDNKESGVFEFARAIEKRIRTHEIRASKAPSSEIDGDNHHVPRI